MFFTLSGVIDLTYIEKYIVINPYVHTPSSHLTIWNKCMPIKYDPNSIKVFTCRHVTVNIYSAALNSPLFVSIEKKKTYINTSV